MDNRASRVLRLSVVACLALHTFGVVAASAKTPATDVDLHPATSDTLIAPYLDIAHATFPHGHCEGREMVGWYYMPNDGTLGMSWPSLGCAIAFNYAMVEDDSPQWLLCTVFVHEYGHTAGREHSRDLHSAMYPYADSTNFAPCRNIRDANLRIGHT